MEQQDNPDSGAESLQGQTDSHLTHDDAPRTWPVVAGAIGLLSVGVAGVISLLWASNAIADVATALNFVTQNTLSLFIFLVVVAQSFIYWEQRNWMRKQWQVTNDALGETRKQLALTALVESAYIAVDDVTIQTTIHNHELVVDGKFINGGNTPAWNFRRRLGVDVVATPPPVGWRFDWTNKPCIDCDGLMILANRSINFSTTPRKISLAEIAAINSGQSIILIVGKCEYLDGTGAKQTYTFGLTLDLGGPQRPPKTFIHYQHHSREQEK